MRLPHISRINSRLILLLGTKAFFALLVTFLFIYTFIKVKPSNYEDTRVLHKETKDRVFLNKAISYLTINDMTRARAELEKALTINPGNNYAGAVLGKLSSTDKGEVFLEIEKLKRVLVVRDDYWAAWARLSYLYDEVGEFDLAMDAKQKADSLAF